MAVADDHHVRRRRGVDLVGFEPEILWYGLPLGRAAGPTGGLSACGYLPSGLCGRCFRHRTIFAGYASIL